MPRLAADDRDASDAPRTQKPAVGVKKSVTPGIHRLPGRRKEAENAEALSALPLQPDAGRISGEVGPARRLSDGRAELRRAAFGIREEDRPWPHRPGYQGPPSRLDADRRPEICEKAELRLRLFRSTT